MTFDLPPMAIYRKPRVGQPVPPRQEAEIRFEGPLIIDTTIKKKVLARVLQAQHHGTKGNSRMGGRLATAVYAVKDEIELYKRRIRQLEQEKEELST